LSFGPAADDVNKADDDTDDAARKAVK